MKRNNTRMGRKFAFYGFSIGFGIWSIAFIAELFFNKQGFNENIIVFTHRESALFYLLDLLPFIFAYGGYRLGLIISTKHQEIESIVADNDQRNSTLIEMVDNLKRGNFSIEKEQHSKDKLIDSIFDLRDSLKSSKEEESIRKQEDEQRHWVAQGLAKFGEILRANNDNMSELSYNIISQLVKYVSANQGGIYLSGENEMGEPAFELKSCYAYERRKFVDKFIKPGEGLVGACARESKTIYLKKLPDSYLSITSGLGQANPKVLLLVPLKFNEETFGVLEIASFNEFSRYVVEFIEKVAESIASTISNVKINIRTSELLRDSQEQAEMLTSQEEEMRQNMEELQATQEESIRQAERFSGYIDALDRALMRAEFDSQGNLISANHKFLEKFEVPHFDDIYESNITNFIYPESLPTFRSAWGKVVADNQWYDGEMKCITFIQKPIYISCTLSRVNRNDGEMEKVMLLALDSTEQKEEEIQSKTILSAIGTSLFKAELSNTGDLILVNGKLRDLLAYGDSTTIHNIHDFINEIEKPSFEKAWMRLNNNGAYEGVINFTALNGSIKTLEVTLIAIRNLHNSIVKIILLGTDKSAIKEVENRYEELNEKTAQLQEALSKTDEELNKRIREVREQFANQYKEVERIRIRNDKTVENAPIAILAFNNQGVVEVFNKKAAEIWGYHPSQVINLPVSKLFPKEQVQGEGYVASICDIDKIKPLNQREKVQLLTTGNKTIEAFVTLADARVAKDHNYVAYVEMAVN